MREDGATVERTVIFRVVEPALGVMGVEAAYAQTDDVAAGDKRWKQCQAGVVW